MSTESLERRATVASPRRVHTGSGPWWGMGAVVAVFIASMTPMFGLAALASPVEHGLRVSGTAFGLVLSAFFAVSALGAPVARRLAVRLPVPGVLAGVGVVAAVALLLVVSADGFGTLLAAMVLAGAGNAFVQPIAGRFIVARVPARRLSLATGLLSASLSASPLLPGLLAALVAGRYGWRAALMVATVLVLLTVALVPLARLGTPVRRPAAPSGSSPRAETPAGAGTVLLLWTVAAALATIGSTSVASYFIQIGTHSGLPVTLAGLFQSAAGAGAIAVRLTVGALADRAPRRNPTVVAVMMLSGAVGLGLIALGHPATFVAGAILVVAGGWGWTGLLMAAVMRLLPGQGARAGAAAQTGLFSGAALAPFAFGAATAAIGLSGTVLLAGVAAAAGAGTMLAGAAVRRHA